MYDVVLSCELETFWSKQWDRKVYYTVFCLKIIVSPKQIRCLNKGTYDIGFWIHYQSELQYVIFDLFMMNENYAFFLLKKKKYDTSDMIYPAAYIIHYWLLVTVCFYVFLYNG